MTTVAEMQSHIEQLCRDYGIAYHPRLKRSNQSFARRRVWEITIAPVKSAVTYGVALHEIGHCLGQYQRSHIELVREDWAWRWARKHALCWTPAMERAAVASLATYRDSLRYEDITVSAARRLGLTNRALGQILGLPEWRVRRMKAGAKVLEPDTKPFELSGSFVYLSTGLHDMTDGDKAASRRWLRTPNSVLGGKPLELMLSSREGMRSVMNYVDSRIGR